MRKTENEEVNNIMLEFFIKCRAQNIPVTGPMLHRQRKLHQVCRLKNFLPAMVGWRRFGIGTISTSGHYVMNLPMSTKKQQMIGKGTWLLLLKDMQDQFNADETAVFYRQLLRQSMVFKGESCKVGKIAKERLNTMCCSATGDKLKPLVIGNAARPRAFKAKQSYS